MKRTYKALLFITLFILFGFASEAQGGSLSARGGKGVQGCFKKSSSKYRVDVCTGKPKKKWKQQVVYRALNNTYVYQHRNNANIRHDEVSSQAIMFHVKAGKLHKGHVYQNRGN